LGFFLSNTHIGLVGTIVIWFSYSKEKFVSCYVW